MLYRNYQLSIINSQLSIRLQPIARSKAEIRIINYQLSIINYPEHGTISVKETGIDLSAVEDGTKLYFVATPEEGYELDAWSGCAADGSLTVYEAVTVTCTFKIKTFFVTFVDWDDAVLKTAQKVTWGEAAVPPADPTREGYVFTGWNTDFSSVKSDLTVKAQYEEEGKTVYYKVTYYDWDLTLLGSEKVAEGEDAKGLPTNPTREGYDFVGWSKPLTNITSDLSVAARYEKNSATAIDETDIRTTDDTRKFIENGVLYINRNGILYDAHGTRLD